MPMRAILLTLVVELSIVRSLTLKIACSSPMSMFVGDVAKHIRFRTLLLEVLVHLRHVSTSPLVLWDLHFISILGNGSSWALCWSHCLQAWFGYRAHSWSVSVLSLAIQGYITILYRLICTRKARRRRTIKRSAGHFKDAFLTFPENDVYTGPWLAHSQTVGRLSCFQWLYSSAHRGWSLQRGSAWAHINPIFVVGELINTSSHRNTNGGNEVLFSYQLSLGLPLGTLSIYVCVFWYLLNYCNWQSQSHEPGWGVGPYLSGWLSPCCSWWNWNGSRWFSLPIQMAIVWLMPAICLGLYTKYAWAGLIPLDMLSTLIFRCCQIAAQELRVPLDAVFTSESSTSAVPSMLFPYHYTFLINYVKIPSLLRGLPAVTWTGMQCITPVLNLTSAWSHIDKSLVMMLHWLYLLPLRGGTGSL